MTNNKTGRAFRRVAGAVLAGILLAGCQTVTPEGVMAPVVTPVTKQSYSLRTLPAPTQRIAVAVYDFPDLTGQYKERETVQTLSRAVTQGGAPMLIKALQDAGERRWFSVLDRARLDDILKERQIVTEMRRIYRREEQINPSVLPPLNHAGIIMQGGITGYDTNTLTGGLGARYLGIGGDTKWQQDTVTVTLRAVSTNTGEVLSSVTVHKAIASYAVQGGAFRFVALDRILEAEAGVTQNEPKQIAVQQAIEKAVVSLIIEGAELGVWSFSDRATGNALIAEYRAEKYGTALSDVGSVVVPPATQNAAMATQTVAAAPQPVRVTQRQPTAVPVQQRVVPVQPQPAAAPAQPQLPPPPAEGEVLGSDQPAKPDRPIDAADDGKPARLAAAEPNA